MQPVVTCFTADYLRLGDFNIPLKIYKLFILLLKAYFQRAHSYFIVFTPFTVNFGQKINLYKSRLTTDRCRLFFDIIYTLDPTPLTSRVNNTTYNFQLIYSILFAFIKIN